MDAEWELDRIRLYQLWREYPSWSRARLAQAVKRSLSWVKKWLKRFRECKSPSLAMFRSQSRAPKTRQRQILPIVRNAILSFREQLRNIYRRVVGAKTILYHLHRDKILQESGAYLPRSSSTIWKVLKEAGQIPSRIREHHPLERPEPMQFWEMDFGQLGNAFEFFVVVDRGTSILVDTQTESHYNAESSLLALSQTLLLHGLPQKIRCDNDTRFVGSWLQDEFPSPMMRFLLCLGIEVDLAEPGKPYLKPYVERNIRTLKHECLWEQRPADALQGDEMLKDFRHFYNAQRANQSLACGNRPPYEAFPQLPKLGSLPEEVDPDAWLKHYHRRIFKRRLGKNGVTQIDSEVFYVGYQYGGERLGFLLDAEQQVFHVLLKGQVIKQFEIPGLVGHRMSFGDYLKRMLEQARQSTQS